MIYVYRGYVTRYKVKFSQDAGKRAQKESFGRRCGGGEKGRNYVKSLENLSEHFLNSAFARLAYYFYGSRVREQTKRERERECALSRCGSPLYRARKGDRCGEHIKYVDKWSLWAMNRRRRVRTYPFSSSATANIWMSEGTPQRARLAVSLDPSHPAEVKSKSHTSTSWIPVSSRTLGRNETRGITQIDIRDAKLAEFYMEQRNCSLSTISIILRNIIVSTINCNILIHNW